MLLTGNSSVPTNAVGTSNVDCGHWYTIVVNDTCESVEAAFGISNTTFYFLNPQIEADCRNLWLGNSYVSFFQSPLVIMLMRYQVR